MSAWQEVRCPACHNLFFEAFGISAHLAIRVKCRICKRMILIKEGFVAEIIGDAVSNKP